MPWIHTQPQTIPKHTPKTHTERNQRRPSKNSFGPKIEPVTSETFATKIIVIRTSIWRYLCSSSLHFVWTRGLKTPPKIVYQNDKQKNERPPAAKISMLVRVPTEVIKTHFLSKVSKSRDYATFVLKYCCISCAKWRWHSFIISLILALEMHRRERRNSILLRYSALWFPRCNVEALLLRVRVSTTRITILSTFG